MTLSTFALDGPVSLDATTYGATLLRQARMIRPVTFTIGRDGNGRFPADQLLLALDLTTESAGPAVESRQSGPLRGWVNASLDSRTLRLALDAAPFGSLVIGR